MKALGEEQLLNYIKSCFEKREPLERGMHNKAMMLFKQYMLVGGMPKPVILYIENGKNFNLVDAEKRDILKLYRNDIMKIKAQYRGKVLAINGHKLYFYTHYSIEKHRNDMEIDFIISNNSKLKYQMYPIEVKSGKRYTTTSLNRFIEKYKSRIGESYIIHPRNLVVRDNIICIPAYMTFCL